MLVRPKLIGNELPTLAGNVENRVPGLELLDGAVVATREAIHPGQLELGRWSVENDSHPNVVATRAIRFFHASTVVP